MDYANKNQGIHSSQLSISNSVDSNTLKTEHSLNVTQKNSLTISGNYHMSEIQQNEKITETTRKLIWGGFLILVAAVLLAICGDMEMAEVATVSGTVTEFISGVIFVFLTKSNDSKMKYFEQLSFDEECNKYIQIIDTLNNDEKVKLLNKLVSNYCDRRKGD